MFSTLAVTYNIVPLIIFRRLVHASVRVCRTLRALDGPSALNAPFLMYAYVFVSRAVTKRCNNAQSPDKYGHYREAKYSQTKHHWFWKVS